VGKVGSALTRKIGPAPAYVWLGLFAVGMVILRMIRRPSNSASTAGGSSGPIVPVNIGPTRQESSTTVQLFRPASQPLPYGTVNRKSEPAFQGLIDWWMQGGSGTAPDAQGVRNKRDRTLFEQELNYYKANPYSAGTIPTSGGSDLHTETTDPTTGE
jgi:hypothetical protein